MQFKSFEMILKQTFSPKIAKIAPKLNKISPKMVKIIQVVTYAGNLIKILLPI